MNNPYSMQPTTSPVVIEPSDKEKMEAIIKATCQYYELTEAELLHSGKSMDITAVRRQCLFLILTNTHIKPQRIAIRFHKKRDAILRALAIIQLHKEIYAQTSRNLKAIVAIANTFEKTTEWHIQ